MFVNFAMLKSASQHRPIPESKHPIPLNQPIQEIPLIHRPIGPLKPPLAMFQPLHKVPLIMTAILELLNAEAGGLIACPFPRVRHQLVGDHQLPVAIRRTIVDFSSVVGAVGVDVEAVFAIGQAVPEGSLEVTAIVVEHLAVTMGQAIQPLPDIISLPLENIVGFEEFPAILVIEFEGL